MKGKLIPIKEVAERVGCSNAVVHNFKLKNQIEFVKTNGKIYFDESVVPAMKKWLEDRKIVHKQTMEIPEVKRKAKPLGVEREDNKTRNALLKLTLQPLLVRTCEACAMLAVSEGTLLKFVRNGFIHETKLPTGSKRYSVRDLENFVAELTAIY